MEGGMKKGREGRGTEERRKAKRGREEAMQAGSNGKYWKREGDMGRRGLA